MIMFFTMLKNVNMIKNDNKLLKFTSSPSGFSFSFNIEEIKGYKTFSTLKSSLEFENLSEKLKYYLCDEIKSLNLFKSENSLINEAIIYYAKRCALIFKEELDEQLLNLGNSEKLKLLVEIQNSQKQDNLFFDLLGTPLENLEEISQQNRVIEIYIEIVNKELEIERILSDVKPHQQDWEKTTPFIRGEQTLKLNLLHQFGIIEHLKKIWKMNHINNVGLEILICKLINAENASSIRPRLSSKEDPKLRNETSNEKLEEFLKKFNLLPDKIKLN